MTLKELYLEAARVAEMVEGSEINFWNCVKDDGLLMDIQTYPSFNKYKINRYEFALAVVEGKPVFKGDLLWLSEYPVAQHTYIGWSKEDFNRASWNPPKPKTVKVELLIEDAEFMAKDDRVHLHSIHAACRKALEGLKS